MPTQYDLLTILTIAMCILAVVMLISVIAIVHYTIKIRNIYKKLEKVINDGYNPNT